MRNINYDVRQFNWNGDTTTFTAEAWNLAGCLDDGILCSILKFKTLKL